MSKAVFANLARNSCTADLTAATPAWDENLLKRAFTPATCRANSLALAVEEGDLASEFALQVAGVNAALHKFSSHAGVAAVRSAVQLLPREVREEQLTHPEFSTLVICAESRNEPLRPPWLLSIRISATRSVADPVA